MDYGADIVIVNAKGLTMDPYGPTLVEAISIKGNRFWHVGNKDEVLNDVSRSTRIIDANECTVLPGFNDTHVHATHYARYRKWINLESTTSIDQIIRILQKDSGERRQDNWIFGFNYNHRNLTEKRHPLRTELDRVSSSNPVAIVHVSGHFWTFNTKGLELLNISKGKGSSMVPTDHRGDMLGTLAEDAVLWYVYPALGLQRADTLIEDYKETCYDFNRLGVTSLVHVEVETRDEILAWQTLREEGKLTLRVNLVPTQGLHSVVLATGFRSGFGDEWIRMGPLKLWVDGSVMGGTAALNYPYCDNSSNIGMLRHSPEEIQAFVSKAHREGYQITAHTMGDRAVSVMADAYEAACKSFPRPNSRHRLEHCAIADKELLKRLLGLGVMVSIQPSIVNSYIYGSIETIEGTIGRARSLQLNDFRGMLDIGIILSGGSDAPSGNINPIIGIDCAVNRRFEPLALSKRLSLEQALRIFTYNGAYFSFEEHIKGSIRPGNLADCVFLSKDIMSTAAEEIVDTTVKFTICDGKVVYAAGDT